MATVSKDLKNYLEKTMKLRNKKTGEIKNVNHNKVLIHFNDGQTECIKSLAELNEEWEDYEEPLNQYWFINDLNGTPMYCNVQQCNKDDFREWAEQRKQIGNYFETKEEAEQALEKLRAWKRLKDKGFRFVGWRGDNDKHHLDGVAWYEMRLCGGYDIETANDLEMIFDLKEKEK